MAVSHSMLEEAVPQPLDSQNYLEKSMSFPGFKKKSFLVLQRRIKMTKKPTSSPTTITVSFERAKDKVVFTIKVSASYIACLHVASADENSPSFQSSYILTDRYFWVNKKLFFQRISYHLLSTNTSVEKCFLHRLIHSAIFLQPCTSSG